MQRTFRKKLGSTCYRAVPRITGTLLCGAYCIVGLTQQTIFKDTVTAGQIRGTEDSGADRRPFLGPVYPEDLAPVLPADTMAGRWLKRHKLSAYGWLDGGVTTTSGVSGQTTEAPVPNRFSNQVMLDAAWFTMQRPLGGQTSWGFRTDFYAGSDAALLRPRESFGPQGPRWGTDFRQAYISLRVPHPFAGGVEIDAGRINVPTGYETLMAPYRPIYSEGYFWIHYEVGSTAAIATMHPGERLTVLAGTVMGYNTVFTLRGRAPSYIGRLIYKTRGETARQWLATIYTGPEPFSSQPNHVGRWQTLAELQSRQVWTPRLAQVVQVHYAEDFGDPATGGHNTHTAGAFLITSYKVNSKLYLHSRLEWFSDTKGVRIAKAGTYSEATFGLGLFPLASIDVRPEIRGDFAGQPSFGAVDQVNRHRNQLSFAVELVSKAKLLP